jgi:hypothetical protein
VSGMRKAVAGLAGLVLAGGACLGGIAAAPIAGAASAACGHSCSSLYNQKFRAHRLEGRRPFHHPGSQDQ